MQIKSFSLRYLAKMSNSCYVKRRRSYDDPYAVTVEQLEKNVYGNNYTFHLAKEIEKGLQVEFNYWGENCKPIQKAISMGCKITFN